MKKLHARRSLKDIAEMVRQQGTGGDTILAHIHPHEARLLEKHFGGTINSITGLPEYGRFFKNIAKIFKKVLPVIGSIGGTLLGGPLTSALGGALGGALGAKKGGRGMGALMGAGMSLPISFLMKGAGLTGQGGGFMSSLGNMFGGGGNGDGEMRSVGQAYDGMPSGNERYGMPGDQGGGFMSSLGNMFGGGSQNSTWMPARYDNYGIPRMQTQPQEEPTMMQNIMRDPLKAALLATSIAGSLGRRERTQPETGPTMHDMMQRNHQMQQGAPARRVRPLRRGAVPAHAGHRPGIDPEHIFFDEVNPETEYYAKGGYVQGNAGGQDDDVPMKIPENSFVMDATTVSLLGDGNSANGAKKLKDIEDRFMKSGITRDYGNSHHVNARVSGGEYIYHPHAVEAIGGGDNAKGAKVLDKMRKQIRKEKGLKTFLPPKTKKLSNYIR